MHQHMNNLQGIPLGWHTTREKIKLGWWKKRKEKKDKQKNKTKNYKKLT